MNAPKDQTSTVLIISGMHRSGTSLTASLLQSAGLHIGKTLMPGGRGNIKGHFENLDFYEFHKAALRSQGIHHDGWTLQETIEVDDYFVDEAKRVLATNAVNKPWGWKDPRTTLFLAFWANLLPQAKFVLVYRSPWEVVDSLYRRGDAIFQEQPDLAVKVWMHYNQRLLNFNNSHPERCLLINAQQLVTDLKTWIAAINTQFETQLTVPQPELYEPNLMHSPELDTYRMSLIDRYFPNAIQIYQQLEAAAWHPTTANPNSTTSLQQIPHYRIWAFQDWMHRRYLERQNQQLQEELARSQAKLEQFERNTAANKA